MASLGVGKEVISHCNKCKLALAHIIVTMKTPTTVGKVECKTCKGVHAFKDPNATKKKATRTRRASTPKVPVSELWEQAVDKAKSPSQKYSPRSKFVLGDLIDHPKFGQGVIEKLIDNDKIEVIFKSDIKTLVHNK